MFSQNCHSFHCSNSRAFYGQLFSRALLRLEQFEKNIRVRALNTSNASARVHSRIRARARASGGNFKRRRRRRANDGSSGDWRNGARRGGDDAHFAIAGFAALRARARTISRSCFDQPAAAAAAAVTAAAVAVGGVRICRSRRLHLLCVPTIASNQMSSCRDRRSQKLIQSVSYARDRR